VKTLHHNKNAERRTLLWMNWVITVLPTFVQKTTEEWSGQRERSITIQCVREIYCNTR